MLLTHGTTRTKPSPRAPSPSVESSEPASEAESSEPESEGEEESAPPRLIFVSKVGTTAIFRNPVNNKYIKMPVSECPGCDGCENAHEICHEVEDEPAPATPKLAPPVDAEKSPDLWIASLRSEVEPLTANAPVELLRAIIHRHGLRATVSPGTGGVKARTKLQILQELRANAGMSPLNPAAGKLSSPAVPMGLAVEAPADSSPLKSIELAREMLSPSAILSGLPTDTDLRGDADENRRAGRAATAIYFVRETCIILLAVLTLAFIGGNWFKEPG